MSTRLTIDFDDLTPAQRTVYDVITSDPRGVVEGPLRVWLASPDFAEKAQALGAFCRYGTSLPARLSELAILVTGAHWRAGFEWAIHAPIAVSAGLTEHSLEAIQEGRVPRFELKDEAAVYAFASELVLTGTISDRVFGETVDELGETSVVELVGILGYYALICMTIKAFKLPLPAGSLDPFPESSR